MWPTSSISARIGLERSGIAPIATEKNTAKITICRISFCAIASAIEVGIRWVRNFSIEKAETGRPVDCASPRQRAGEVRAGLEQVDHDEAEQQRHEGGADEPAHGLGEDAAELASREPIWAMPPTRVANTSGAMIILIRRRNIMAIRLMDEAHSARVSGRKL